MLETTLTIGQLAYNAYNFFAAKDDEFQINSLEFAKVCVSLWSRCCPADLELANEGCEAVEELLNSLFGKYSLFPENIKNREAIYNELFYTFSHPISMKIVIDVGRNNDNTATKFYEQACFIFSANDLVDTEEREFLDELALELNISDLNKKRAERKYLMFNAI
jgi:hypothetical protein